jgi:hypothetical protein
MKLFRSSPTDRAVESRPAGSIHTPLADLDGLDRAALLARWETLFGHPAPSQIRMPLLLGAIAWRMQMDASPQWAGKAGAARLSRLLRGGAPRTALPEGTRLVREWQGHTHQVMVTASGFEHSGQAYRSLSAVARAITGTPWSGPAFFGLTS